MSTPQSDGSLTDLPRLKRRAKELLVAFRQGDAQAVRTVGAHFDGAHPSRFRLAHAQLVVARSLGYASWARLRDALGVRPTARRHRSKPAEMVGAYVYDVEPVDGERAWALFEACRDGDGEVVRELVAAQPALVHAQYWYTQPIHFAVYANQPEVLRLLLDHGSEPGRTRFMDSGWKKLLARAEAQGFDEVHRILSDAAGRRFGYHPAFRRLRDAIVSRDPLRVEAVLAADPHLGRATDEQGNTSLHWAVMTRQPDLVPLLAGHGVEPDGPRSDGQTPAHLLFNGDYEFRTWRELKGVSHADQPTVLRSLVDAGATVDLSVASATGDVSRLRELLVEDPTRAHELDSGRRSPLTYAARAGHIDAVRLLLDHGADPNRPEDLAPRGHALWMACATGRADIVRLLLEHGADPNAAPDSSDSCLGITRSRAGDAAAEIEALLRSHQAVTPIWHMSDEELRTALESHHPVTREPGFAEEALARNDPDLADLLLSGDPDVARRLHGGSLRQGSPDVALTESAVLRRLLDAGFDPNRPDWLGKTALHHYAGRGERENVLLVLEYGGEIDALDDEYRGTALAWAAARGHVETVRLLLEHGADPTLPREVPNARPAARARIEGHEEVVRLLQAWA